MPHQERIGHTPDYCGVFAVLPVVCSVYDELQLLTRSDHVVTMVPGSTLVPADQHLTHCIALVAASSFRRSGCLGCQSLLQCEV
jgi:hypothetical protein